MGWEGGTSLPTQWGTVGTASRAVIYPHFDDTYQSILQPAGIRARESKFVTFTNALRVVRMTEVSTCDECTLELDFSIYCNLSSGSKLQFFFQLFDSTTPAAIYNAVGG